MEDRHEDLRKDTNTRQGTRMRELRSEGYRDA